MRTGKILADLDLPWMNGEIIKEGTIVYEYMGYTYGCITPSGVAVTKDPNGGTPFFEVPQMYLFWIR